MKPESDTELLSGRGRALSYIAHYPGCTIREISSGLFLTRRTVWGDIGQLRSLIDTTKEGRKHRYEVKSPTLIRALLDLEAAR